MGVPSAARSWWMVSIYALGAMYWGFFLGWGEAHTFDWMLYEPLFTVMQTAVRTGQIPYHAALYCAEDLRDSYLNSFRLWAAPWVVTSPDVLALAWLRLPHWIVLHTVLLYSIGFWGVVKWIRKLNLSAPAAMFVMAIYVFNGFYSAKLGVGHIGDLGGYFLVPWVFWIWAKFLEADQASSRDKLLLALEWACLISVVIAFGALHVVQTILMGSFFIFIFRYRLLPWLGLGFGAAFLVAAYRFLPILLYSGYGGTGRLISSGYGSFGQPLTILPRLYEALLTSYTFIPDQSWWERAAYISWIGLGLIAAAIQYPIWRQVQAPNPLRARPFVWGMLIMFVSLLASVLQVVWLLGQYVYSIPTVDQYPARMIIFLILYVVLLASTGFDSLFDAVKNIKLRLAIQCGLLISLFGLLVRNSWLWSLPTTGVYWPGTGNNDPLPALCPRLLEISGDETYKSIVNGASLLSLIAIFAFAGLYLHLKKRDKTTEFA